MMLSISDSHPFWGWEGAIGARGRLPRSPITCAEYLSFRKSQLGFWLNPVEQVVEVQLASHEIGRDAGAMKKLVEVCGDARLAFLFKIRGFRDPSIKFPVRSNKFPVTPKKFPVPLRREFRRKPLNSFADCAPKSQAGAGIDEILC
jgi:hypothetical protein